MVSSLRARFYGLCPSCGHDGLVDHGSEHRECLICGYDSGRDRVQTPREWLRETRAKVDAAARIGLRWVEAPRGWRLTRR